MTNPQRRPARPPEAMLWAVIAAVAALWVVALIVYARVPKNYRIAVTTVPLVALVAGILLIQWYFQRRPGKDSSPATPGSAIAMSPVLTWPELMARRGVVRRLAETVDRRINVSRAISFVTLVAVLGYGYHDGRIKWVAFASIFAAGLILVFYVAIVGGRRLTATLKESGLTCPQCGEAFVDMACHLQLRGGACRSCGTKVVGDEPALPLSADVGPLDPHTFAMRLRKYARAQRIYLLLPVTPLLGIAAIMWAFWGSTDDEALAGAFVLLVLVVLGGSLIRNRWWSRQLGALGLRCWHCDAPLAGGNRGELTRETISTGVCGACGARVVANNA